MALGNKPISLLRFLLILVSCRCWYSRALAGHTFSAQEDSNAPITIEPNMVLNFFNYLVWCLNCFFLSLVSKNLYFGFLCLVWCCFLPGLPRLFRWLIMAYLALFLLNCACSLAGQTFGAQEVIMLKPPNTTKISKKGTAFRNLFILNIK